MHLILKTTAHGYDCYDEEQPDEPLGSGGSPDEALGEAVRNAWLMYDHMVVDDISSEEN